MVQLGCVRWCAVRSRLNKVTLGFECEGMVLCHMVRLGYGLAESYNVMFW